jgi:hypothetical protein
VYYHSYSDTGPYSSNGEQGWGVVVATHVGDDLTYKIPTNLHTVILLSDFKSALSPDNRNQCCSSLGGET